MHEVARTFFGTWTGSVLSGLSLATVLRAHVAERATRLGTLLSLEDGVAATVGLIEQQARDLGLSTTPPSEIAS